MKHSIFDKLQIHKRTIYFAAVILLPLFILSLVFFRLGIYPFGDSTLVYHDMQYQYVDFFMWFHNVLHGKDSLDYSFFAGMGGNTIALFAYYLSSPLNLLSYFFPVERMADFLTLLISLKLILCCVSAYLFIRIRFGIHSIYGVMMAVSYGLMGYSILQCSNIMWLDGVFILPIIAIGVWKLIWQQKCRLYFFALFYGIVSNWYIGYMLCLFAVLYVIFEAILFWGKKKEMPLKTKLRAGGKQAFSFGLVSVLSFLSSSFLFVPQALHMMREGKGTDGSILTPGFLFSYLNGLRDFFLQPDKLTFSEGTPPVFVGTVVLILTGTLFFSHGISKYKKVLAGVYLVGFMFVFTFKPLNYIFTAFKIPSSHTFRYAFLFSFFLIAAAGLCLKEIPRLEKQAVVKSTALIISTAFLLDAIQPYPIATKLYLSCAIALIMGICIVGKKTEHQCLHFFANVFLIFLLVLEFSTKAEMEFEDHQESASKYAEYNQTMKASLDSVRAKDSDYFRMDKTLSRSGLRGANESLAFGYSSLSQYSSSASVQVGGTLIGLGYTGDITVAPYTPILSMDSVLGVKYIYSREPVFGCELIQEQIYDGISLYRNPYALPLGYQVNPDALDSPREFVGNVFENHEIFYAQLLGHDVDLYTEGEVLSQNTDGYSVTEWEIKAAESGPMYAYFLNGMYYNHLSVNDSYVAFYEWYDRQAVFLGDYKKGETVKLKMAGEGEGYREDYGLCTATLNMQNFETAIDTLRQGASTINEMSDGKLTAGYTAQTASKLLLTLPNEKGWTVKVNGEESSYSEDIYPFTTIDLPAGTSQIKMSYSPPGIGLGALLSAIGFSLFGFFEFSRKKRRAA